MSLKKVEFSRNASPVCVNDMRHYAKAYLPKFAFDYYESGADDMLTLEENEAAYSRLRIRNRVLRDVSHIDTSIDLFGQKLSSPICIAPTACMVQKLSHPDGEIASARAAKSKNTCMILSSWSTASLEDVMNESMISPAVSHGLLWFQLYVYKDRRITEELIKRAHNAGYKTLVVTVDTPYLGKRRADVRNGFALPPHLTLANFSIADKSKSKLEHTSDSGLATYVASQIDPTLSWDDIKWVMSISEVPVLVKGVMTVADAELAVSAGVSGIIVSNHGGRQLDGVPGTIDILPRIVKAVRGRIPVFVDGGIRKGSDVLKALALGAKAVFVGRPVLWGLAYNGKEGVENVLSILHDELKLSMALTGCKTVREISADLIVHADSLKRYTAHSKL
ncbi:hydroxyacid oxidase 1-like protein [Paraphysoderma sedebokerense]|nr:hydroxyacid oxidase 1-like protein [Paraphysoderma sedebokerense]